MSRQLKTPISERMQKSDFESLASTQSPTNSKLRDYKMIADIEIENFEVRAVRQ